MADPHPLDDQRLAFGQVAELYERARPSYPAEAVDAVLGFGRLSATAQILEVGAGTGKATVLFAQRGLAVTAMEPSPDMARIARANCAGLNVEVIEAEFETWRPTRRFAALVSVCAWHWIAADVRYQRAHAALEPGGTLAAIWTFPDWARCALRPALSRAYHRAAPQLPADFPMHPDSQPTRLAGDWRGEIERSGLFHSPAVSAYPWSQRYDSSQYCRLLQTHQDHILLAPEKQTELLRAVADAIDEAGGSLTMPFATHVCLARRT